MPQTTTNPAPTQPPAALAGATLALVLLTALNFVNYIDRYILPGVQEQVKAQFHVSDSQIGSLTFWFFLTYMLAAPATGWLGDHFPRKPLIIVCALLISAINILTGTVHAFDSLIIRHAFLGIGEASLGIFAPALIADFYPEADRNRVLTIFYTAIPVGAAIGYLVGEVVGSKYGWRMPFYVSAVPGLLIAILILFFMQEPARGASDAKSEKQASNLPGTVQPFPHKTRYLALVSSIIMIAAGGILLWLHGSHQLTYFSAAFDVALAMATVFLLREDGVGNLVFDLFRNRPYLYASLGMAMVTFSLGGISAWMPSFLQRSGFSPNSVGITLGAITAGGGLGGTAIGGWLAQRWLRTNHRALYLISAWSALLTIPFAVVTFFGPRVTMLPSLAVAMFLIFLGSGPLNAAIINAAPAAVRSTAIALEILLIHALGDTPSPKIIGIVSDHSTLSTGLGVTLITMLLATILLFLGARTISPRPTQA